MHFDSVCFYELLQEFPSHLHQLQIGYTASLGTTELCNDAGLFTR